MTYQVKIIADEKGMADFLQLPFQIYQGDPNWVAPLESEVRRTLDPVRNPYFHGVDLQKFVCYKGFRPVSRAISVINPKHWEKFGRKTAFFGFFESENDSQASIALFSFMGDYCHGKGVTNLEGPFNPNHYSELGLLVRNFSRPAFFETYNPEYYHSLLKKAGLDPVTLLHTRVNPDAREFSRQEPAQPIRELQRDGYRIRSFNMLDMKAELERIREVYNDAFADNWHFLPVSHEEYQFQAGLLFLVTNPSLIQIVEHEFKPVGVLQCVLNVNPLLAGFRGKVRVPGLLKFARKRFSVKELVLYATGIKKDYRHSKVTRLLFEAFRKMTRNYPVIYSSWMSDTNIAAIKASESAGLAPYKWFEIYDKQL